MRFIQNLPNLPGRQASRRRTGVNTGADPAGPVIAPSRAQSWRRAMIGAPPYPEPIPRQPRARHRIHQIMRRIWAAEVALVRQLHEINDAADAKLAKSLKKQIKGRDVQVRCK
jgi:hypothetical protein